MTDYQPLPALRNARELLALSLREAAAMCGTTKQSLSNWERGMRRNPWAWAPSYGKAQTLCRAYQRLCAERAAVDTDWTIQPEQFAAERLLH
jgi:transcriptional regulator with XRE-family HTH domain